MSTAAPSITHSPFASSLFSSIKSAFLISATTVLSELWNAMWIHVAVGTDLALPPLAEPRGWHLPNLLTPKEENGPCHMACECSQLLRNVKLLCNMNTENKHGLVATEMFIVGCLKGRHVLR